MDINTELGTSDPAVWHDTQSYANALSRVEVLLVVNDLLLVASGLARRVVASEGTWRHFPESSTTSRSAVLP
jgi:hypothetical protein